ncbi:MAG: NAD(P)H-quinone oxidoreductase [Sphingobacterium sp.]|uniref:NAD(P)H-quinone oxidoreductase n=1 Tax=Sphingobacterium sp. JB170 TaxID=1434842 RepID=UPI00097EE57E|nr:NAD(P)H-quinone oxidoreductase [Sphingobacterium sp. JB170]SJN44837.1 Quinone oxidoreductase [Sphingobacterium sp. JB170]
MHAIVITKFGGPEVLEFVRRVTPPVRDDEVLVAVKAAGVNRPDVFQRKGNYPAPPGVVADIPGLEVAGMVVALGKRVTRWSVGDRVCALVGGGGYATHVAVHQDICLPVPVGLSYAQAAILPENIYTVWDNVFRRGRLSAADGILVHGGSGGIGSTTIQLAKAFGARVFTTSSTPEKCKYCTELGADRTVNYKESDFYAVLQHERIDVILDSLAGDYFEKNIDLLAPDGRLVYINATQGAKVPLNIFKVMQKRLLITGSTLRARDTGFKAELTESIFTHIWPFLGQKFRPQVFKEIPLEDAAEAHRLMESGNFFGKIVLVV